jgi:hypothetical protein
MKKAPIGFFFKTCSLLFGFIVVISTLSFGQTITPNPEDQTDSFANAHLKGVIISNTQDSTLLKLIYGNCQNSNGQYYFNQGPQMWDNSDSVFMKVEERLGDDTTQIVFIRGVNAITAVMHNYFTETALMLKRTRGGWVILDGYIDKSVADYAGVELTGVYHGSFLIRHATSGVYGGGLDWNDATYSLIGRDNLSGPTIRFLLSNSNTASSQCDSSENSTTCTCYSNEGEVVFHHDSIRKCLIFEYTFLKKSYDCGRINERIEQAHQTWYMNGNTSFMGEGNPIDADNLEIKEKIKLTEIEINQRLTKKHAK